MNLFEQLIRQLSGSENQSGLVMPLPPASTPNPHAGMQGVPPHPGLDWNAALQQARMGMGGVPQKPGMQGPAPMQAPMARPGMQGPAPAPAPVPTANPHAGMTSTQGAQPNGPGSPVPPIQPSATESISPAPNTPQAVPHQIATGVDPASVLNSETYKKARDTLRGRESSNDYTVINKSGHVGAYQFGIAALEDAGLVRPGATAEAAQRYGKANQNKALNDDVWVNGDLQSFLSNPDLQEQAKDLFDAKNLSILQNAGVLSENASEGEVMGALMAAHLGGVGGAIAYLRDGTDAKDANGTYVSEYYDMGKASAGDPSESLNQMAAQPPEAARPISTGRGTPFQQAHMDFLQAAGVEASNYGNKSNQYLESGLSEIDNQIANQREPWEQASKAFLRVGTGQGRYSHDQALQEIMQTQNMANDQRLAPHLKGAQQANQMDQNTQQRRQLEQAIIENMEQVIAEGPLEAQMLKNMFGNSWVEVAAEMALRGVEIDGNNIDAFGRAASAIAQDLGIKPNDIGGSSTGRRFKPDGYRDRETGELFFATYEGGNVEWRDGDNNPVPADSMAARNLVAAGLQTPDLIGAGADARREGALDAEQRRQIYDRADSAADSLFPLRRLEAVIDKLATGSIIGPIMNELVQFAAGLGAEGLFGGLQSTDFAVFNQATKDLLVKFRSELKGQGAITDYETNMLAKGLTQLGYSPEANRAVVEILIRGAERSIRKAEEMDKFLNLPENATRQGKAFNEFEDIWRKQLRAEAAGQWKADPEGQYNNTFMYDVPKLSANATDADIAAQLKGLAVGSVFVVGEETFTIPQNLWDEIN